MLSSQAYSPHISQSMETIRDDRRKRLDTASFLPGLSARGGSGKAEGSYITAEEVSKKNASEEHSKSDAFWPIWVLKIVLVTARFQGGTISGIDQGRPFIGNDY